MDSRGTFRFSGVKEHVKGSEFQVEAQDFGKGELKVETSVKKLN